MAKKNLNKIQYYRQVAFKKQSGLCFYCNQPMWNTDKFTFTTKHKLKAAIANFLQCTAEHLLARQDGGKNTEDNIVAACKYCNHTRHKTNHPLSPEKYKQHVQIRLQKNRWHQIKIY